MPDSDSANPKVFVRRMQDKLLTWLLGLVMVLIPVIWGITWGSTRSELGEVRADVQKRADGQQKADEAQWQIIRGLNDGQQVIDRRVTTLEAQQSENARVFQRVEKTQAETDKKIDKLNDKIDQVLREVRK
jgi:uncharacterized coiled-coil protein SlyX